MYNTILVIVKNRYTLLQVIFYALQWTPTVFGPESLVSVIQAENEDEENVLVARRSLIWIEDKSLVQVIWGCVYF